MNRILVTGAGGQIGSDLVAALSREDGTIVISSDIQPREDIAINGASEYLELDVTDRGLLAEVILDHRVDTVFHLAALLSAKAEKQPDLAWNVNMEGLRNVLEVARDADAKVFWPSSIAVFGPGLTENEAKQDSPLLPTTMYGVTKVAGELLCRYYHQRFGLDTRSIRFPGIISHTHEPGGGTTDYAVQIFHAAAEDSVYECFLKPDAKLPMMMMTDAVRAIIELMKAPADALTVRTAYNLAAVSFAPRDVASEIRKYISDFEVTYEPDFRQRIAESWPQTIDDTEAREDWSWEHKYDLETIARVMLEKLIPETVDQTD